MAAGRASTSGPSAEPPAARPELGPILAPGLRVLFVGINPSLRSAEVGHHFARPGNRFWATLHAAGFTPRRLRPDEDAELPAHGIGVTNIADRPTRAAAELAPEELRRGARALEETVRRYAPRLVAVVGLTAYRAAFARPGATMGLQAEPLGGRPVWVLPNPSGLNAHYKPADFARLYADARRYADALATGATAAGA
jgi:TDG/mug DNA glycosylase family protein